MTISFAQQARQVISYEANPENIIRIYDNARVNHLRNVIIRNVAISDVEGLLTLCVAPLHSGEASGNAEIAASILKNGSTVEQFSVATTIDEDARRHGIAAPDLVKIDIEGMELQALRGMRNTLTLKKPDLYIELHGTTPDHKRTNGAQ